MSSGYTPRPGSLVASAIEVLQEGPLTGLELAERIGTKTERLTSLLAQALINGAIVKEHVEGSGRTRAVYRLPDQGAEAEETFECALWDNGMIYMKGVQINEDGAVALTLDQSRVLAKLVTGQVYEEQSNG